MTSKRAIFALAVTLFLMLVIVVLLLDRVAPPVEGPPVRHVDWEHEAITDQDGAVIVGIEAFPDEIQVSEDTGFGSSGRFTGAVLSPDRRWIAVTTANAAHAFGWLYHIATGVLRPVSFQYGGSVELSGWSPDGTFAAFGLHTPAGARLIDIADRRDLIDYVEGNRLRVRVPREDDLEPPYAYAIEEWRDERTLCFALEGEGYCIDAATGRH